MEIYFEYQVECNSQSDGQYDTPELALEAANKEWQQMCEDGDYEFGRGDGFIIAVDNETGKSVMQMPVILNSDSDCEIADGM